MSAPYVTLDRPGLVYSTCWCCRGDGRSEFYVGDRCRECACTVCGGRGYVVTESERGAAEDGSDDGLCTRFYPSVEGEAA